MFIIKKPRLPILGFCNFRLRSFFYSSFKTKYDNKTALTGKIPVNTETVLVGTFDIPEFQRKRTMTVRTIPKYPISNQSMKATVVKSKDTASYKANGKNRMVPKIQSSLIDFFDQST
jgi:hypothetical protein